MTRKILIAGLMAMTTLQALPWGQKGHDTTAFIAEQHLTPATKVAVEKLLEGKSIVYYSNWLDNASHTPEYDWTKTWHYKNIDADKTYENAPLNDKGDVVRAIYQQTQVLTDPDCSYSESERQLALKIIIHLLGDIHQPMHMGRLSDLGGNGHRVAYFDRSSNLHSVWDTSLPESAHKWSYTEWQNQIDRLPQEKVIGIIAGGNPDSWGKETYNVASEVYENTPENLKIEYNYIARWTPTIEMQFLKGGLRLADLLNSIFDPEYTPQNSFVKK